MNNNYGRFASLLAVISIIISLLAASVSCSKIIEPDTDMSVSDSGGYRLYNGNYYKITANEDMSSKANDLVNFYNACDNASKAMLYVGMPTKSMFAGFKDDYSAKNESGMTAGINRYYMDALRPSDFEDIGLDSFMKTCGYYKPKAGYSIYSKIMETIIEYYNYKDRDLSPLKAENHKAVTASDSFTGEYAASYNAASGETAETMSEAETYSVLLPENDDIFRVKYKSSNAEYISDFTEYNGSVYNTDTKLMSDKRLLPILSDDYTQMILYNLKLTKPIIVFHNLEDLSVIGLLSQTFGKVISYDLTKTDLGTAEKLIGDNTDAPLVLVLIDITRPLTGMHTNTDIKNLSINEDGTTTRSVRSSTRRMVNPQPRVSTAPHANNLLKLKDKLDGMGCELMYIAAPPKITPDYTLLPEGAEDHTSENLDEFLSAIDGKVDYIDCRSYFDSIGYDKEKWFYDTDHHWHAESAFIAYQKCINKIKDEYGWYDVDPQSRNTDINNFTFDWHEKYYIGSNTRDFNINYAGSDDFCLIIPKFDTLIKYMRTFESGGIVRTGTYYQALIDQFYLDEADPVSIKYAAYIGGDRNSNKIENYDSTASDKKILMVEDSFSLPVDCFMSLNFKELYTIDIRFYTARSISAFVKAYGIDMVVIVYSPETMSNRDVLYKFN
ncbi:MAG: hypothetical protein VB118_10035 [Oscillospiraceae bacterium]|nr:hypothetical protein [Oscillospiraceae bacterium]